MSARSSIPAATIPPGSTDAANASTGEGPVRTCIGCRSRERITAVFRVVAVGGYVVPDLRRRLPGRGAWLHPDEGCLLAAERRRAFGRALRVPEPLDTSRVRGHLREKGSDGSGILSQPAGDPRAASRTRKQVDPT
jgi:predicted RNA-binding protein YlxR (DUF448 family)